MWRGFFDATSAKASRSTSREQVRRGGGGGGAARKSHEGVLGGASVRACRLQADEL